MIKLLRRSVSVAALALGLMSAANAQVGADPSAEDNIKSADDIVVQATIGYRFRADETVPTLVYDTDYFQRFEPLTAGDALKRVPSVTFLADVIESDGARLRGLPPSYTQILINGEKVPGSNADRSFFVDRIPAELISRVEIVRSSSARRTGDAIAGTLNIVLRDGLELDGGYVRAGALRFDDGEYEPSVGAVYGGEVGPGRVLLGLNFQGRHNPKLKSSFRFGDSPENNANFRTDDFENREDQTDTRDGKDYSVNASYKINGDTTDLELSGFYVKTDRIEDERSFEYNDPTAVTGRVRVPAIPGNLLTDNANVNTIDQENYTLGFKLDQDWQLGKTSFKVGYSKFDDKRNETEFEIDFNRATPRFTGDLTLSKISDKEVTIKLDHEIEMASGIDFVFGGFLQNKTRRTDISEDRNRFNVTSGVATYDQFARNPTTLATAFDPTIASPGGRNDIEERRRDAFALVEGKADRISWEAGLRYESTKLRIFDFTVAAGRGGQANDYDLILPSASVKIDVGAKDRLTASVARTNRRPDFNFVSPALLEAELGDNDLQGNPQLDPETAWGGDLGYERRLGSAGVIGINLFYRKVKNLIEVTNTGVTGSEGTGTFVLRPQNVGDGEVYGVEFDLSTDLGFVGLSNTGIFGNYSYLDSRLTDFAGKRRFNGQSKSVYNIGFIQNFPSFGAAFGATYRKQGAAFDRIVGEEIVTTYGADLEVFVEKRFGKSFTIRAVGSNLLNASKDEVFNKFTTFADQASRDFDEFELESERAGPFFQIIARYAF